MTATGNAHHVYRLFVGGEWQEASSADATFEVSNPASGETFAVLPDGGRAEMRAAIDAAGAGRAWRGP